MDSVVVLAGGCHYVCMSNRVLTEGANGGC